MQNMSVEIKIIEATLSIQQNVISVFHVIIQTSQYKVSLVRYPFDFLEFHQKILLTTYQLRLYYSKNRICLPSLQSPPNQFSSKFKSLQHLLPRKSNAEKIQKYLEQCFSHPALSSSSLLKDFTRVQRDEDRFILLPTSDTMKAIPPLPATLEDFSLIHVLGKGCMGKVLLVRSKKSNRLYALKTMQKKKILEQKEFDHIQAERNIMVRLRNQPFLVHLYHVFQSESSLFFLLEYHSGGDLAVQLATRYCFPPETVRMYAAEIVQGLSVIHQHGIVYRDLKPENILISKSGHLVLADFGLSKLFKESDVEGIPLTQTFCGTAEYLAPEILLGEPYTFVVDFWSLGTLLYEMLTGTTPFWASNHMEMYRKVIEEPFEIPKSSSDKHMCNLLSGLLEKESDQRLGWGQDGILEIKCHPYFATIDWNLLNQKRYPPPYIPELKQDTDIAHFDPNFTQLPASISQSSVIQQDPFTDFNYDSLLVEFQKNTIQRLPSQNIVNNPA